MATKKEKDDAHKRAKDNNRALVERYETIVANKERELVEVKAALKDLRKDVAVYEELSPDS